MLLAFILGVFCNFALYFAIQIVIALAVSVLVIK